ncbi:CHAT domain-containing protein [Saccharothrix carnea]|uniref:CHAT domain-containing protein n=1 Tax=Saccharothrix carnea TaxID=1280637 RepID=A0A2P8HID4_SACCR|nr:CHAT domain-containing protein [Saccharothrix carnea]PSL45978.1 CHAT domain-containing protein [Saccharothrix carnea]
MTADEDGLAAARVVVVDVITAAWHQLARRGEFIPEEVRDAVIAVLVQRSPRTKIRMIAARPELLSHEAERLVDSAAVFSRDAGADARTTHYFAGHLGMFTAVRLGDYDLDLIPEHPRAHLPEDDGPPDAARWVATARGLKAEGRTEEARNAFTKAVRQARVEGNPGVEGEAELGLFALPPNIAGARGRKLEHAEQAVQAYRRAADVEGECHALVAMVTVLTHTSEPLRLDVALKRLALLDADSGRWWREYSTTMRSDDLDRTISGLRWCVEHAGLLGFHADFYRDMCAGKLAFYEERRVPVHDRDTPAFRAAVTMVDLARNGPTHETTELIDRLVREVEDLRRYARSQAVQRELSLAHQLVYDAAVRSALASGGPERAVDLNELASSRALLVQTDAHRWWERWHPGLLEETRPVRLAELLGRFAVQPTERTRRLLLQAFKHERSAQDDTERWLLSAEGSPTTTPPPVPVRTLRTLLADDHRVVVYASSGAVFLISRDDCRLIGQVDHERVQDHVDTALSHLSAPEAATPGGAASVAYLVDHVVRPLRKHVREGARLVVVPSEALWRIPLAALAPVELRGRDVSCVPSLSLLARLLGAAHLDRRVERFVGFGDPDGSLRHARDEIRHAAGTFADSFTLLGEDLGYHRAMANLADADVAHIACHGLFFPEYPDFSALLLAGPAHDPEVLWYGELARYRLRARLVVLAACHAGTGSVAFGSEYVGFPGAFLTAGARQVLAPLWAVSDLSTALLMRYFYSALATPASPAAALREAQRRMAANPATAHPYHWAGFQLFGAA